MLKNKIVIIFLSWICGSCIMTQEISFNEDLSGEYKFTYDFSEYSNMFSDVDYADSLIISNEDYIESLEILRDNLNSIGGISRIRIENKADMGIIYYSFMFSDLEALNSALKYTSPYSENIGSESMSFVRKGKKLYLYRNPVDFSSDISDESMRDLFKNKLIIRFQNKPRKININNEGVIILNEGKEIIEEGDLYQIAGKKTVWEFRFRKL